MRAIHIYAVTPFLVLLLAVPQAGAESAWSDKMRDLRDVLSELLPDLVVTSRFEDPSRKDKIEKNAEKFASLAHQVSMAASSSATAPPADSDITLQFVSGRFAEESAQAVEELKRGNRVYARRLLVATTQYCVACHTRTGAGPSFDAIHSSRVSGDLAAFDRAEYLSATRRYDEALENYLALIGDAAFVSSNPFDWEKALHRAIAISVRVKNDPKLTLKLVDKAAEAPGAPKFVKEYAQSWRRSVTQWMGEKAADPKTDTAALESIRKLIGRADKLQRFPIDRGADILYLRATALAHRLLARGPKGPVAAEALFLAGICADILRETYLWTLNEAYYEACIHASPRSEISRDCYRRYEESVYLGYTGSSGTHVPQGVSNHLQELRLLAGYGEKVPSMP